MQNVGEGGTQPPLSLLLLLCLASGCGLLWASLPPSACPSLSPSPFPPHEQLLMAVVGGAVVIAVVVVVVMVVVVVVVMVMVMVSVVLFTSPLLSPTVTILFLVVGLHPLTLPHCLCCWLSFHFVVVLIHFHPENRCSQQWSVGECAVLW